MPAGGAKKAIINDSMRQKEAPGQHFLAVFHSVIAVADGHIPGFANAVVIFIDSVFFVVFHSVLPQNKMRRHL